ncbi:vWA domain-containing protein [Pleomorphochaeta sp. DL1XJH-081]|uniref:vWA domain-containing protein n=1 Tax=Pleomorphochaeta sp. DL1XJH-081 TaxID=3409690 RepID=UPI003BB54A89
MKHKRILLLILVIAIVLTSFGCDLVSSTVESLFDGGFVLPPDIATNTIDFEITGVGTGLRGYDNFPSITLYASPRIKDTDTVITGLVQADFFDVIDDNGEARPIEVNPPKEVATEGEKQADIVFVIDTTGSMYSYLDTMVAKAQDFADTLASSNIDYRVGYVTFGDDIRKGTDERLAPTSDIDTFKTKIATLTATGGADGPENQIDALDYARAGTTELTSNPAGSFQNDMGFSYRIDAAKVFILITDIGFHTPESPGDVLDYYSGVYNTVSEEIAKLIDSDVNCYVVAPTGIAGYERIADETGGKYYPSGSDFDEILLDIGTEITYLYDYQITFMTNDFTPSKLHTLRLAVHTSVGDAEATVTYTSPAVVNYDRAMEIYERGLGQ